MIPDLIRPFLWSYDPEKLEIQNDKERIITNVLNLGTFPATQWLFKTYDKEDIKNVVSDPKPGEWDFKSYNFWCTILSVTPNLHNRFE